MISRSACARRDCSTASRGSRARCTARSARPASATARPTRSSRDCRASRPRPWTRLPCARRGPTGVAGAPLALDGTHPVRLREVGRRVRGADPAAGAPERDDARSVERTDPGRSTGPDAAAARLATAGVRTTGAAAEPPTVARSGRRGSCCARPTTRSAADSSGARASRRGSPRTRTRSRSTAPRRCWSCATSAASRSPRPRASTRRRCAPTRRSPPGSTRIWDAMSACVEAGLHADGVLPGMLQVKRRAGAIREQLEAGRGRRSPRAAGGVARRVRARGQRGERRRRSRRHGSHERGGRHPARRRDVLVAVPRRLRARCRQRRHAVRRARRQRAARVSSARRSSRGRSSDVADESSSPTRTAVAASVAFCSPRPRWGRCSRRTPRSRAPRAGARPRSARRARWPPAG